MQPRPPQSWPGCFIAPQADGFGVNCGASGLVVLDCDVKPGIDGRDTLRDAGLPWLADETPRAHPLEAGTYVLRRPRPSRMGVLEAVDIKSEGGVVLPPAPGRVWQAEASPWDVSPSLAPCGSWGSPRARVGLPKAWLQTVSDYVKEGKRNVTAASIAGHLLARGVDPRLAAVLLIAWGPILLQAGPIGCRGRGRLRVDLPKGERMSTAPFPKIIVNLPPPTEEAPWGDRQPLPPLTPPVPALPPDLLPPALRPWLSDIADRLSVPLEFPSVAA
ncbi:MAG: bifunctional DNA primase/polymerase, partial [Holophagales bacterium]|nr:bifunctional DNA primase/polymerase [Holophagales bacterium]